MISTNSLNLPVLQNFKMILRQYHRVLINNNGNSGSTYNTNIFRWHNISVFYINAISKR